MLASISMLSLHMFSNPHRQLLSYFVHRRTDVKTDVGTERRSGQSDRQRRGEQSGARRLITPALFCFGGRKVKRDGVARRRGPIQTQHHLLQCDYRAALLHQTVRGRNQPRRLVGNNPANKIHKDERGTRRQWKTSLSRSGRRQQKEESL